MFEISILKFNFLQRTQKHLFIPSTVAVEVNSIFFILHSFTTGDNFMTAELYNQI